MERRSMGPGMFDEFCAWEDMRKARAAKPATQPNPLHVKLMAPVCDFLAVRVANIRHVVSPMGPKWLSSRPAVARLLDVMQATLNRWAPGVVMPTWETADDVMPGFTIDGDPCFGVEPGLLAVLVDRLSYTPTMRRLCRDVIAAIDDFNDWLFAGDDTAVLQHHAQSSHMFSINITPVLDTADAPAP